MNTIYPYACETITGESQTLDDYDGQVLLIVNTASKCGLTPQFEGLETLYQSYKDQGFTVLGFPCNQFAKQDPANNEAIAEFCQMNYGVSFPMFAKVDVNGKNTHPLFKSLKEEAPGLMGMNAIKWNFTKFLVNRKGEVVKRFAPAADPKKLSSDIEKLLAG